MSRAFRLNASLALNVVFAVAFLVLVLRKSERAPESSAREVSPASEVSHRKLTESPALNQQSRLPQYTEIASASDRRQWVDQLRAAGVPNKILAGVVLTDLDEQWNKRIEECHGDADKMAALQRGKERDDETELRAALGE